MGVPELFAEAPGWKLHIVLWAALAVAGAALALVITRRKTDKHLLAKGAAALACAVSVIAGVAGAATVLAEEAWREDRKALIYEAALFERYGLAKHNWNSAGSSMPSWKDVREAGESGLVSQIRRAPGGEQDVKITLSGTTLTVTVPGGQEMPNPDGTKDGSR